MGLIADSRQAATYCTILDGKIVLQVPEGTEGATERVNKSNNKVYELKFGALSGTITGLYVQQPPEDKKEYGEQLVVYVTDKTERYALKMRLSSSYALGILSRLDNVILTEPVEIKVFQKADKEHPEKINRVAFIKQNGVTCAPVWTRDEPGDLPPLECLKAATKKAKAVWSSEARCEFLAAYVEKKNAEIQSAPAPAVTAPELETSEDEDNDDLPF